MGEGGAREVLWASGLREDAKVAGVSSAGPSQASHRDPECTALGQVQALPPAGHRDAEKSPHPAVPDGPRKTASHSRWLEPALVSLATDRSS